MAPSIRVTPEGYHGLKKLIDAGYAKTMSGAIDRFLKEEGVIPEKPEEKNFVKPRASNIDVDRLGFVSAEDRTSNLSDKEKDIVNMLGDSIVHYRYQRDAMRAVFQKFNGDKYASVKGYQYLEEKGYVKRKNNKHKFNARYYAEALYNDGKQKGWLTISEETREFFRKEGIKPYDEDVIVEDVKEKQKNENFK